jgi:hypothetical protein
VRQMTSYEKQTTELSRHLKTCSERNQGIQDYLDKLSINSDTNYEKSPGN